MFEFMAIRTPSPRVLQGFTCPVKKLYNPLQINYDPDANPSAIFSVT